MWQANIVVPYRERFSEQPILLATTCHKSSAPGEVWSFRVVHFSKRPCSPRNGNRCEMLLQNSKRMPLDFSHSHGFSRILSGICEKTMDYCGERFLATVAAGGNPPFEPPILRVKPRAAPRESTHRDFYPPTPFYTASFNQRFNGFYERLTFARFKERAFDADHPKTSLAWQKNSRRPRSHFPSGSRDGWNGLQRDAVGSFRSPITVVIPVPQSFLIVFLSSFLEDFT